MNICKKIMNCFRKKTEINGKTIEDIRLYGYCFFNKDFYNKIEEKITVEIYEFEGKTYLIRSVDDKCVMFEDLTAIKN